MSFTSKELDAFDAALDAILAKQGQNKARASKRRNVEHENALLRAQALHCARKVETVVLMATPEMPYDDISGYVRGMAFEME